MWPALLCWTSPGVGHNSATPAAPLSYPGLSDAAAGDSLHHITGLAQLLMIGLLAFPIWMFGLLIGLLLPKGFTESRAASAVSEESSLVSDVGRLDEVSSRSSSMHAVHISSRPLSDDELESSSSEDQEQEEAEQQQQEEEGEEQQQSNGAAAAPLSRAAGFLGRRSKPNATANITAGHHSVSWAQQLSQLLSSKQQVKDAPETPPLPAAAPAAGAAPRWYSPFSNASHNRNIHGAFSSQQQQQQSGDTADVDTFPPSHRVKQQHQQGSSSVAIGDVHRWYVSETDLGKFTSTLAPVEDRLLSGNIGAPWSLIMDKEVPGVVRYLSYWRPTDNGSTDYLSVTIIPDATAQEMHEYNLDDVTRTTWDPMLKSTWLLGNRDLAADEQLVVWLRTFPMGFLSDRLYAGIARRTFADPRQPNSLMGVSKVVHTPTTAAWAAEHFPGVIQTDNYFSAWRCRTIPSPWANSSSSSSIGSTGSSTPPACELILLHHDELKVPEYLSRLAIKVGMWKFVQGMVDAAGTWLEARRSRVDPFQPDPAAACRQRAPPLTGAAAAAAAEAAGTPHHHPTAAAAALFAPKRGDGQPARDSAVSVDVGDAGDALLSPRLLYAVPTAPDLLSLGIDGDEQDSCLPGVRDRPGLLTASLKAGSHRRGHSMEWEPVPDSSSTDVANSQGVAAAATGGVRDIRLDLSPTGDIVHVDLPPISTARPTQAAAAAAGLAAFSGQQQQQQQRHGGGAFGFNPVQALRSFPGSATAAVTGFVGGLAGEVSKRVGGMMKGGAMKFAAAPGIHKLDARCSADVHQDAVPWGGKSRDQDVAGGNKQGKQVSLPASAATAAAASSAAATDAGLTDKARGRSGSIGSGGRSRSSSSTAEQQQAIAAGMRTGLIRGVAVAAGAVIGGLLVGLGPSRDVTAQDSDRHGNGQRRA